MICFGLCGLKKCGLFKFVNILHLIVTEAALEDLVTVVTVVRVVSVLKSVTIILKYAKLQFYLNLSPIVHHVLCCRLKAMVLVPPFTFKGMTD